MPELEREFARESFPTDFGEFRFVAFRDCDKYLSVKAEKPGHYRD